MPLSLKRGITADLSAWWAIGRHWHLCKRCIITDTFVWSAKDPFKFKTLYFHYYITFRLAIHHILVLCKSKLRNPLKPIKKERKIQRTLLYRFFLYPGSVHLQSDSICRLTNPYHLAEPCLGLRSKTIHSSTILSQPTKPLWLKLHAHGKTFPVLTKSCLTNIMAARF